LNQKRQHIPAADKNDHHSGKDSIV
jgi:hypothetical protein